MIAILFVTAVTADAIGIAVSLGLLVRFINTKILDWASRP